MAICRQGLVDLDVLLPMQQQQRIKSARDVRAQFYLTL